MPTTIRLTLHFSGQKIVAQEKTAANLLAQISPAEHATRARLHAILAASRVLISPLDAADSASESAREAEHARDDVSRAWSMIAACIVDVSPGTLNARVTMSGEAMRIAQAADERELVPTAYFLHLGALAEAGAIEDLDLALSPSGTVLSAFPWLEQERHVVWFRCLRATIDGQPELAEQLAGKALRIAEEQEDPDAQTVWLGQLAIIRWMQGRVVELEPAFLHARRTAPHEPVWAASLAWMWLQQGRRSAARALISTMARFDQLPVDRNWLATSCLLAIVAAELDEIEIARAAYDALVPYEDRIVTMGLGITTWGTVARPLALLARTMGDDNAAIRHYRAAAGVAARAGAHSWLAEIQIELAALLATRSHDVDAEEAIALVTDAMATGRALRLRAIEESAAVQLSALSSPRHSRIQARLPSTEAPSARIRVLGTFEVASEQGTIARWQSRKARQLLQILVAKRGVAISRETVMHLLWPDESSQRLANRLSVAATTVRRAFDPAGLLPKDTYLEARGPLMRLCVDRLDVDVERFLTDAYAALSDVGTEDAHAQKLADALASYHGEPLINEPEQLWAQEFQREVHIAFFSLCHALAHASDVAGDQLTRLDCYRKVLAVDPYDQRAHEGQLDALTKLGATTQLSEARTSYSERMSELGIPLVPR
ncbi:AfsR/SARP family transcriptional regulator [Microbacterium sp. A84]